MKDLRDVANIQDIFDFVVENLWIQGEIAVSNSASPMCAYRSDTGLKCGVGWLIPDRKYNDSIEGEAASDTAVMGSLYANLRDYIYAAAEGDLFLSSLQSDLHDNYLAEQNNPTVKSGYRRWLKTRAEELALDYHLDWKPKEIFPKLS